MKLIRTGVVVALIGMHAACAAENSGGAAGIEEEAEIAESLQSIQAGAEKVEFFAASGGILMSFSKPNALPRFAIDVLEEKAGHELTPLEIFQSLAPEGAPHARLLADHAQRARVLGRADASVVRVVFEPQLIEKAWTPEQCEQSLIPNAIVQIRKNDLSANFTSCTANRPAIPQGSCNHWIQTNRHRAGVCNNSSTASLTTSATITSDGARSGTNSATVPGNTSWLWTGIPALNSSLTAHRRSKMLLVAGPPQGSTFHARLADY